MRLAVYSDAIYSRHGDDLFAEETFVVFTTGLREKSDRLVLVGRLAPGTEMPAYRLRNDVELLELPHYESLANPGPAASAMILSIRRFWRLLDDIDAVWLLGPHPLAILFAVLTLARRRRVVLGVRQDMPAHMRARYPGRRLFYLAALLLEGAWRSLSRVCPTVVVGPDLARRYRRARSLSVIAVSVVEEEHVVSVDEALARSFDDELLVLSVGRVDPEKNPLLLVEVLSRLRKDDERWELVVCGEGALLPELRGQLEATGLGGSSRLLGFVPLQDLRQWYQRCQVLLHVSWTEGVPQVLFEAFAAGLPVVATDVGGVAEIADGAALLIPPGDADAAAAAVRRLVADPELRSDLVRKGLGIARRHTSGAGRDQVATLLGGPPNE